MHYKNRRNPILPLSWHFPDCEARVIDGRLYLYGSMDTSENAWCSDSYYVVSSNDMESWTVHSQAFDASQVSWAQNGFIDPEGRVMLYAPDAIKSDGRYYLYFCLSDDSEGVATSHQPEGPFRDAVRLPVKGIDPAVFIDDDGQAYYYWGQFSANVARLNNDMTSLQPDSIITGLLTEREHHFHEGISVRKRNGIYYLVYTDTSRGKASCLGYATGTSPLGPFTYRGVIVDNDGCDPSTWNNHGSIQQFNGQWYVFYHRSSRDSQYMRRVCIEPIQFLTDGSIPEVQMTSQGAGEPFAPGERIPAFMACRLRGKAHLRPLEHTEMLVGIGNGDAAWFRYLRTEQRLKSMRIEAKGSGVIQLFAGELLCGEGEISSGSIPVDIPAGNHELCVVFPNQSIIAFESMTLE